MELDWDLIGDEESGENIDYFEVCKAIFNEVAGTNVLKDPRYKMANSLNEVRALLIAVLHDVNDDGSMSMKENPNGAGESGS